MIKFYAVNGKVIPAEEANIQITDLGLLRGYGIFDFLKIQQGIPLFIEDHLARFKNSAQLMNLQLPHSTTELKALVMELIEKNEFAEGGMKIVLTGGYSEDGYLPSAKTNCLVLLTKITKPSNDNYQQGVKLMLYKYIREMPEVKTTSYLVPIRLANDVRAAGAYDVLYHSEGKISESSRSNFFIVNQKNQIVTPQKNILNGITRQRVLAVARQNYEVLEGEVTLEDLKNAKEAFLSSTTKHTLFVRQVDDIKIGDGQPVVCQHLNQLLEEQSAAYVKSFSKE